MNPDNLQEPQPVVTERTKPGLLIIALIILFVFIVFGFIYYSAVIQTQTQTNTTLVPETVTEEPDSVDLNQLAKERLEEVDQGQGLVDVYVRDDLEFFLTTPAGATLYQRTEGFCEDECLNAWVPYSSSEPFEGNRLRAVLVNEEYSLHYVLFDDKMLFTYFGEDGEGGDLRPGDTKGNGLDDVWTITRP
jgi:predicted lipoprotein with Yx(FWY)xxD motif